MSDPQTAALARFQRKREELVAAARLVFTREGYMGASMDAVAAEAAASKRTVYQYFEDKRQLFAATVLDTVDRGYEYFKPRIEELAHADDVESALRDLARAGVVGLMDPELLKMRRLVIAEAERFPDIGREYYERSWVRTLALLADAFKTLTERGLLYTPDPERAAYLFTWLYLSIPANRAAFLGDAAAGSRSQLLEDADEGVRVFLAAYGSAAKGRRNRPARRKTTAARFGAAPRRA